MKGAVWSIFVLVAGVAGGLAFPRISYQAYSDNKLLGRVTLPPGHRTSGQQQLRATRGPVNVSLYVPQQHSPGPVLENVLNLTLQGLQAVQGLQPAQTSSSFNISTQTSSNITNSKTIKGSDTPPVTETGKDKKDDSAARPLQHTFIRRETAYGQDTGRPSVHQLMWDVIGQLPGHLYEGLFNGEAVSLFSSSCKTARSDTAGRNQALATLQHLASTLMQDYPVTRLLRDLVLRDRRGRLDGSRLWQQVKVLLIVAHDAVETWLSQSLTTHDMQNTSSMLKQALREVQRATSRWIPMSLFNWLFTDSITSPFRQRRQRTKAPSSASNPAAASSPRTPGPPAGSRLSAPRPRAAAHPSTLTPPAAARQLSNRRPAAACRSPTVRHSVQRLVYAKLLSLLLSWLTPVDEDIVRLLDYSRHTVDDKLCRLPLVWLVVEQCGFITPVLQALTG